MNESTGTAGSVLLDTNVVIAWINGDLDVIAMLPRGTKTFITTTVLGELYYGAQMSSRTDNNLQAIGRLAESLSVLDCDQETAYHYGDIKAQLRRKGRPIPENDIWIAAAAIRWNARLITRDSDFASIDGLVVERL